MLGIIGLGKIGAAIARRGHFGFGMKVLYSGNTRKPDLEAAFGATYVTQEQLLERADFVCPVVPLSLQTRGLIGADQLHQMKSKAILINISRGAIVDEQALIEALKTKVIRAAGLDVYAKEPLPTSRLFELDNVVTVPHIGSPTKETRETMADRALQKLLSGLVGERPHDLVNPATYKSGRRANPA